MPATAPVPRSQIIQTATPAVIAAALAAGIAFSAPGLPPDPSLPPAAAPRTVTVPGATFVYRDHGEYRKGNMTVDAPMATVSRAPDLEITKYQITAEQYAACVADGECAAAETKDTGPYPVTGVSHDDATAYARWLSARSDADWRLPTDAEAAQAAGSEFPDDALGIDPDSTNPALRWIADYEREAALRRASTPAARPTGAYGENDNGLADFAGNVWEWTSTCHRRVQLNAGGIVDRVEPVCGVYVTVGKHRSPMSAFIRDPKSGGCAVGTPPENLGFRLVREERGLLAGLARYFTRTEH